MDPSTRSQHCYNKVIMVKALAGPMIGKELKDLKVEKDGVLYVYNADGSLKETLAIKPVDFVSWGLSSEGNLYYIDKDGGRTNFPSLVGPKGDSVTLAEVLKTIDYDVIAKKVNIDYERIIDKVVELTFKEAITTLDINALAEAVTDRIYEKVDQLSLSQQVAKEIIRSYKDEVTPEPLPVPTAKEVAKEFTSQLKSLL